MSPEQARGKPVCYSGLKHQKIKTKILSTCAVGWQAATSKSRVRKHWFLFWTKLKPHYPWIQEKREAICENIQPELYDGWEINWWRNKLNYTPTYPRSQNSFGSPNAGGMVQAKLYLSFKHETHVKMSNNKSPQIATYMQTLSSKHSVKMMQQQKYVQKKS